MMMIERQTDKQTDRQRQRLQYVFRFFYYLNAQACQQTTSLYSRFNRAFTCRRQRNERTVVWLTVVSNSGQRREEKKKKKKKKKNPNFCASIRRKKIMRLCPLNPPAVPFRRHLQDTNWTWRINLLLIVKCSLSVDRGGAPTRSISISSNLNVPTRSPEGSRGGRNRCRQITNGTRPAALVQNQHARELISSRNT